MQKTIKFFISSTFKDFEAERNVLQKFIFPELKKLCHEKGFGFQPIDLRWGVMEEAGYDQQTMNICLNEIQRSSHKPSPNLLLLVGQRYGWVPIPYDIPINEYQKITASIKLKQQEKELISKWYKEDKNSIPTTYYLQEKWKYKDDRKAWNNIEDTIRSAFQKVFDSPNDIELYKKYNTSATEQEMYEGLDAFSKNVDHSHTYAYFRELDNFDIDNKDVEDYIDITKEKDGKKVLNLEKLNDLKKTLQKDCNIPTNNQILGKVNWDEIEKSKKIKYKDFTLENFPEYLRKFHDDILEKFTVSITKEIESYEEEKPTNLVVELEQQNLFLEEKSSLVEGRENEVDKIKEFISTQNEKYYLQYGRSGTGKTSVMAKAISEIDTDKYEMFYRFIGTTAYSTYSRQLFENIYWEIEYRFQDKNKKLPSPTFEYEEDKFQKQFRNKLQEYQENINKPIIVFLDAVDQLEDKNDLRILQEELPENIQVVFSCLYDETKKENEDYYWYYDILSDIQTKNELTSLSNSSKSHEEVLIYLLNTWLTNINRQITDDQINSIKTLIDENTTPLYMKLVFEIVRHWSDTEKDTSLEKEEKKLIIQYFSMIQKKYHHEEKLLKDTLGYISASKDGLSEEELLDLFSRDNDLLHKYQNHRYPKLERLPTAIWSRFYYHIQDFFTEKLIDGAMLISPYHRIIEEAIKEEYYDYRTQELHTKLADYFETLQDKSKTWDKRYNNIHMLIEYPYQLFYAKDSDRLKNILFDLEFAGSVYDNKKQDEFKDIFTKATQLDDITEDELYPRESFYREKDHLITKVDEELWRPHQSLFQLAYEDGLDSPLHYNANKLLDSDNIKFNWLKRTNISDNFYRSGLVKILKLNNTYFDKLLKLYNSNFLSINYNSKTLQIFNSSFNLLFTLEAHTAEVLGAIELSNNFIISFSKDNTIRLWNTQGKCIKVLKKLNIINIIIFSKLDLKYDQEELKKIELLYNEISGVLELNNKNILSYSTKNKMSYVYFWNVQYEHISTVFIPKDIKGIIELGNGDLISYSNSEFTIWKTNGEIINTIDFNRSLFIQGILKLTKEKFIVFGRDQTLNVFTNDGSLLKSIKTQMIVRKGLSLEDNKLLLYGLDNNFLLLDYKNYSISVLEGHRRSIIDAIQVSKNNVITYSNDKRLYFWNFNKIKVTEKTHSQSSAILQFHNDYILSYSNSYAYPSQILTITNKNAIKVYSEEFKGKIYNVQELQNGNLLIIYYMRDKCDIYNYLNDELLKLDSLFHDRQDNVVGATQISHNRILTFTSKGKICIWNNRLKSINTLIKHTNKVNGVIELNNGNLLSYSNDTNLILWSSHGEYIKILQKHKDGVNGVIELNNGNLLSYSNDTNLILWSSQGEYIKILQKHKDSVNGVIELNNGNLLSYSNDTNLILWSSQGEYIKTLQSHTEKINNVIKLSFNLALSYSIDNTIRIYDQKGNTHKVFYTQLDDLRVLNINNIVVSDNKVLKYYDIK